MMAKRDLIYALDRNAAALHRLIDRHRCLAAAIAETEMGSRRPLSPSGWNAGSSSETALKNAIGEAIEVLEESRKSFKSKRLEGLRKKLTRVLIEAR